MHTITARTVAHVAVHHACETIEQVRALQQPLPADAPYAPDWRVFVVVDQGPDHPYRWYVVGLNDNCEPGSYGRKFIWEVPSLCWRYDLSDAVLVQTKHEALCLKVES